MYRVHRPFTSAVAALAILAALLFAQRYLDRAPATSLSALSTAVADPATTPGVAAPTSSPAPADAGLESSLAGEAIGAVGAH